MNTFDKILLGNSPEINSLKRSAAMIAATDVPVLILGESGTGKELVANAIHQESPRRNRPMLTINCAALPEHLAESELFGHKKGAFSGAISDCPGRIRSAEGGTVLLDEIGELPIAIQAKLLRFLEQGECQAVGEAHPVRTNVRILAATNRDLRHEVSKGRFRQDLFYRLNIVPVELPPLRQRIGDIDLLVERMITTIASDHGLIAPTFSEDARERLRAYHWPGNVRELRNFCERMTILLGGRTIQLSNLPPEFFLTRKDEPADDAIRLPENGVLLGDVERSLIEQALTRASGNKSGAARLLGITRDTLNYRIRKYAL
jgi:transcriptional regulator with GAF, ATPase, and Fis domain